MPGIYTEGKVLPFKGPQQRADGTRYMRIVGVIEEGAVPLLQSAGLVDRGGHYDMLQHQRQIQAYARELTERTVLGRVVPWLWLLGFAILIQSLILIHLSQTGVSH